MTGLPGTYDAFSRFSETSVKSSANVSSSAATTVHSGVT